MTNETAAAKIQSVEDARLLAKKRLPSSIYQMFEAGSGSNLTAIRNEEAFRDLMFRPRNGVFVAAPDISTTVLGHRLSMPAIVSSVGFLGVGHRDGEVGVTRATANAGTMQFISGVASTAIEQIMAVAKHPVFYQLYYVGGRDASAPIIDRVKRAGVSGLVLTIDTPTIARPKDTPYFERRSLPLGVSFGEAIKFLPQILTKYEWAWDYLRDGLKDPLVPQALRADGSPMGLFEGIEKIYQQTPTFDDIAWIRRHWDGPLVLKGILTADDARRAVQEGADAIVVSNHGGNVLDGSLPTLRALPEIVDAVGGRTDVLVDSGVRRGTDVLKAVALGAKGVLLGRAYVYALLAAGEPGVRKMLDLFRTQITEGAQFLGVKSLSELDPSFIDFPADWPKR